MSTAPHIVSLAELRHAQRYIARQITQNGCTWLAPIFDRLEAEIDKAEAVNATVARARAFLETTT